MKTKIISKILLTLTLAFVLGSTITQANGDTQGDSVSPIGPPDQFPVVAIHTVNASGIPTATGFNGSIEVVPRGKTGVFVLSETPQIPLATTFVNFKVSGTAIPGVDYVALVSPAYVGPDGFGVILVKTLPDPRGSFSRQTYSVVVTLEPGVGYTLGSPGSTGGATSAKINIKPVLVPTPL